MKPLYVLILTILGALSTPLAAQTEVFVNDDDGAAGGYTENGDFTQSASTGYIGTYRYTNFNREPSYATWTPTLPSAGEYDVSVAFLASSNRTSSAPHSIVHADGTTIVNVDQFNGSIVLREVPLGRFRFEAGTSGYVRMDNNGASGVYVTDTVIFRSTVDTPPTITYLARNPMYPMDDDTVHATAMVTDNVEVESVELYYTASPSGSSDTIAATLEGSNIYGATIPAFPEDEVVTYWFVALDDAGQDTKDSTQSYTVGVKPPPEYRSLWADTWNASILNQSQVNTLVGTAREHNINTLMIEVRKIGDAYYSSNLEPRATNISGGANFDPLQATIDLAHNHEKKVHVHAWFVMQRISRGETLNPQHILSRRPDVIMSNHLGETSASGNRYLDPGHPDSVEHNIAVILDCLENYDIDGVNLDYIRYSEYPGSWGYNPVSVARFNAYHNRTGSPATTDPQWGDWRRECVTLQVKKLYVKIKMTKPHVMLTACTVNWGSGYTDDLWTSSDPYNRVFQDWKRWLNEGILDYNALMSYSPTSTPARFNGWTNFSLANDDIRGSIIGIGAYLQTSVQASMDQLLYARGQGAAGLNIYDWGSETNAAPESTDEFYDALKAQVFTEWVDPPEPQWIVAPTKGIFEGNLTDGGEPIDHGTVSIVDLSGKQTVTDGYGWYGILEVEPGTHTLRFEKDGYAPIFREVEIGAGDIITVNADFATNAQSWMVR